MRDTGSTLPPEVDPVFVTDPSDPRLVAFTAMTDEALRRRREAPGGDLAGLFICEGRLVTERALRAGLTPESLLVPDDLLDGLPELTPGTTVFAASPDVVESITGYRIHRGFLAAFRRPPPQAAPELMARARRLLVTENVTNPTNLGVMIRSAAALGMDAILLDSTSCDPLYRRVVRVSMGAVFSLSHARLGTLAAGLTELRRAGFSLVALDTDPETTPISRLEVTDRMALVLGAEGPGLSTATLDAVDQVVHIPMRPGIDSLNVAAAAAVAAYVVGGLDRV